MTNYRPEKCNYSIGPLAGIDPAIPVLSVQISNQLSYSRKGKWPDTQASFRERKNRLEFVLRELVVRSRQLNSVQLGWLDSIPARRPAVTFFRSCS